MKLRKWTHFFMNSPIKCQKEDSHISYKTSSWWKRNGHIQRNTAECQRLCDRLEIER